MGTKSIFDFDVHELLKSPRVSGQMSRKDTGVAGCDVHKQKPEGKCTNAQADHHEMFRGNLYDNSRYPGQGTGDG